LRVCDAALIIIYDEVALETALHNHSIIRGASR
jgi:hypothetical protein